MLTPRQLKEKYLRGENISQILRDERAKEFNDEEIIEVAYDIQTGLYIDMMKIKEKAEKRYELCNEIAHEIAQLGEVTSILEPGVGEGTTLTGILHNLGDDMDIYAFDISWSRVAYTRNWLVDNSPTQDVTLFTASLLNIPLPTSSIDVVYTAHAIEPNAGYEAQIIHELYRVAKKFVVLVEPSYELAGEEARKRMVEHRYCKGLAGKANHLGYNVLSHRLCESVENEMNPPAITIIEKERFGFSRPQLVCPQYKTELREIKDRSHYMLYSPEALCVYPILDGIPCLRVENAIVASKFPEIVGGEDELSTMF